MADIKATTGAREEGKKGTCRLGWTDRCLDIKHSESVSVHSVSVHKQRTLKCTKVAHLTRTWYSALIGGIKACTAGRYLIIRPLKNTSAVNWNLCQNLCPTRFSRDPSRPPFFPSPIFNPVFLHVHAFVRTPDCLRQWERLVELGHGRCCFRVVRTAMLDNLSTVSSFYDACVSR